MTLIHLFKHWLFDIRRESLKVKGDELPSTSSIQGHEAIRSRALFVDLLSSFSWFAPILKCVSDSHRCQMTLYESVDKRDKREIFETKCIGMLLPTPPPVGILRSRKPSEHSAKSHIWSGGGRGLRERENQALAIRSNCRRPHAYVCV